jgi:hypothetical protein
MGAKEMEGIEEIWVFQEETSMCKIAGRENQKTGGVLSEACME